MSKNIQRLTHFPLKIPQIPFIKGKIPFLRNHAKSINSSQHRNRGLKFGMNHPYKCLQKVTFPIFDILSGCHFIGGKFPPFSPFLREFPSIKWQPLKISKIGLDNFLETLIRMIHAKFQTSMTMLPRVNAFCVTSQKKGCFPLYRDFKAF